MVIHKENDSDSFHSAPTAITAPKILVKYDWRFPVVNCLPVFHRYCCVHKYSLQYVSGGSADDDVQRLMKTGSEVITGSEWCYNIKSNDMFQRCNKQNLSKKCDKHTLTQEFVQLGLFYASDLHRTIRFASDLTPISVVRQKYRKLVWTNSFSVAIISRLLVLKMDPCMWYLEEKKEKKTPCSSY